MIVVAKKNYLKGDAGITMIEYIWTNHLDTMMFTIMKMMTTKMTAMTIQKVMMMMNLLLIR